MGNGTVYKRGNAWCINLTAPDGRRIREKVGPSKKMAERVLSLRRTQVLENRYFPPNRQLGRMPFSQMAGLYMERVVALMKSARTERNRVKYWSAYFGSRRLGQITREEIEAWRRERIGKLRPATINRYLARLRAMLFTAVDWNLLEASPMKMMRFLPEANSRNRHLSLEECQRLIDSCIATHIRGIVMVALHTGMRLGEILGMKWDDVDFASGFIYVRDSKNSEGRAVPLDAVLTEFLRAYPRREGTDLVFCNSCGRRILDIRTGFVNACKRAGIENFRIHDMRHSFAAAFVSAGGDLYVLKEILGHKSITMTQRYAHLSPSYKIKAIDRMNNLWASAKPKSDVPEPLSAPTAVTAASQAAPQELSPPVQPA